ncbi:MAG: CPBP family intramembrane metalloprotease [Deltaproteobacteria bacterium CG11_big_fil_rev_8_21_14_0_20_49_13]|nr:MAG: CPBP family intramembrane metalloprotease [Deltaproteobacteria bacterium CG11_big_fil_rev_8_21_14_0_20_49_13]
MVRLINKCHPRENGDMACSHEIPAFAGMTCLSIVIAFVLWFIMFVLKPFNFWVMMSTSTSMLIVISYLFGRPLFKEEELNLKNISLGIASAMALYLVFWTGKKLLPFFVPTHAENLGAVYGNMGYAPAFVVAILLFFPIGFGEELFWRGYIQKKFSDNLGKYPGLIITAAIYTAVHIPTLNPVLILAALTCGLFWGYLYLLTDSLVVVLISHMIWDPLVFAVFPLN